jgi:hypothetical protein
VTLRKITQKGPGENPKNWGFLLRHVPYLTKVGCWRVIS